MYECMYTLVLMYMCLHTGQGRVNRGWRIGAARNGLRGSKLYLFRLPSPRPTSVMATYVILALASRPQGDKAE